MYPLSWAESFAALDVICQMTSWNSACLADVNKVFLFLNPGPMSGCNTQQFLVSMFFVVQAVCPFSLKKN